MKKIFYLFCAVTLFATPAAAIELGAGAKAGATISTITEYGDYYHPRVGYTAGGFSSVATPRVGVTFEMLYAEQGTKFRLDDYRTAIRDSYLLMPLLVNYRITERISLNTGVQLDIFLHQKVVMSSGDRDLGTIKFSTGSLANRDPNSIAIPIGVSYTLFRNILLEARYSFGLGDCLITNFTDKKYRNNSFVITMGYKFTYKR